MKKLQDIIRPFLAIILGALLFLVYLNYLQAQGATLATGIIAVIFSAFYVTIGILNIVLGFKVQGTMRKVFDVCSIAMFPVLIFIMFLITAINGSQLFGPTSWVILIVMLFSSICIALLYALAVFAPSKALKRIASLFASFFVLALLLNTLFEINDGSTKLIGAINLVEFATYFIYVSMLLNALGGLVEAEAAPEKEPAQVEGKEEKPEEEPAEEAQAE